MTQGFVQIWYLSRERQFTDKSPFDNNVENSNVIATRSLKTLGAQIAEKYGHFKDNGGLDIRLYFFGGLETRKVEGINDAFGDLVARVYHQN